MKKVISQSSKPIGFCCFFVGLIFISATVKCQQANIHFVTYACDEPIDFVELDRTRVGFIDWYETSSTVQIKKLKLHAKNLEINTKNNEDFEFTPKKLGAARIKSKITSTNGHKIKLIKDIEVVELPKLDIVIDVTAPDSKFMWLKVIDLATEQPIEFKFQICMLNFHLYDSLGNPKEGNVQIRLDDFFPSISLQEIGTKFEINDKLEIGLSLIHKEYNLLIAVNKTFIIDSLWK